MKAFNMKLLTIVIFVLAASRSSEAHHSFSATYNYENLMTIEGELAQVQLRNPHSIIYVLVKDKGGKVERWTVEWGAITALSRSNINNETLRPGDLVQIAGYGSRTSGEHRMRLKKITRPKDGWTWDGKIE